MEGKLLKDLKNDAIKARKDIAVNFDLIALGRPKDGLFFF